MIAHIAPSVDDVMLYEDGGMTQEETLDFFSRLIKSGMAWQLQGSYGRTAKSLIEMGYISPQGELLNKETEEW